MPLDRFREGSYHIVLFTSPPDALVELEHALQISEDVIRHLVTRDERPIKLGDVIQVELPPEPHRALERV